MILLRQGFAVLMLATTMLGATESVSIDTKTKKVQNPIVNFGAGNTLNGTGATIIGFPGSSYTFIDSLTQSAGNVSLVNDSASPGNSKYYGTDSGGVLGFHTVTGGGGTFISLDFTGATWQFVNASGMWNDATSGSNLGVGNGSMSVLTTGVSNVAVGENSGGTQLITGSYNTFLGTAADVQGDYSLTTVIGSGGAGAGDFATVVGGSAYAKSNGIAIGYHASANSDNTAVIGNVDITDVYFGSTSANAILHGSGAQFSGLTPNGIVIATGSNGTLAVATPTSTPTPTATPTATATATPTPTPSATATAFPQGFTAHFSRGGAALQVNDVTLTPWTTKYPGTITGFIISADQGTATLKVWKKATGTAIPTIADVINTSGVSLATGTHIDSTTVTDFTTTTVSIGDQFMAQITAVSGGATDITFQIPNRQ